MKNFVKSSIFQMGKKFFSNFFFVWSNFIVCFLAELFGESRMLNVDKDISMDGRPLAYLKDPRVQESCNIKFPVDGPRLHQNIYTKNSNK